MGKKSMQTLERRMVAGKVMSTHQVKVKPASEAAKQKREKEA